MSTDEIRSRTDVLAPHFMGDLRHLPMYAHSHRSVTWWGMMGMIAVEATVFALACASYLYLANQSVQWPPAKLAPAMSWGAVFTIVTLLSILPNMWLQRTAEHEQLRKVQVGLVLMSLIGIALTVVRYLEFTSMHVRWSDSAYGSITIALLGLHTAHLVTDLIDTLVLTALMFTRHAKGRRYVDVAENSIYWNFVVITWIPIYLILYFAPHWF